MLPFFEFSVPSISKYEAQNVCDLLAARLNPVALKYDTEAGTLCMVQKNISVFDSLRAFSKDALSRHIAELEAKGVRNMSDPLIYFKDHGKPGGFTDFGVIGGTICCLRGHTTTNNTSMIFIQDKEHEEDSVIIGPRAEVGEDHKMRIVEDVDTLQGPVSGDSMRFEPGEWLHADGEGWTIWSTVTGRDPELWYNEPKVTTEITVV